ncbi:MAG: hypothetical protein VB032_01795 [Burkholderiaceae bacterium]|nr:hypothetical protein [Burkholderiaceae bacterium]
MPYQTIWEEHGAYVRLYGHIAEQEIVKLRRECQDDHRFQEIRYLLLDLRESEDVVVSLAHLQAMATADSLAKMLNETLNIVVVTHHPQIGGLVDRYASLGMDTYQIRVFAEIDEAREWLGAEVESSPS